MFLCLSAEETARSISQGWFTSYELQLLSFFFLMFPKMLILAFRIKGSKTI